MNGGVGSSLYIYFALAMGGLEHNFVFFRLIGLAKMRLRAKPKGVNMSNGWT